jgi:dipeptidase E
MASAGGDAEDYIERFYQSYSKLPCNPSHIALTRTKLSFKKLESFFYSKDIIFIGGGSTAFLISLFKKLDVDRILRNAWKRGVIMSGMSAGAMCWFSDGFTNPQGNTFKKVNCLGLLDGSFCPHYDRSFLRVVFKQMISKRQIDSGYGVEDGVALHFIGTELKYAVSSRPKAKAYFVKRTFGKIIERTIMPIYLGK